MKAWTFGSFGKIEGFAVRTAHRQLTVEKRVHHRPLFSERQGIAYWHYWGPITWRLAKLRKEIPR